MQDELSRLNTKIKSGHINDLKVHKVFLFPLHRTAVSPPRISTSQTNLLNYKNNFKEKKMINIIQCLLIYVEAKIYFKYTINIRIFISP